MRVVETVEPSVPTLPAALTGHSMVIAQIEALQITDAGRLAILRAVVGEVEGYCGRLFVSGSRTYVSTLELDEGDVGTAIPVVPKFPSTPGAVLDALTVRRWESGTWAAVANPTMRSANRWEPDRAGEYELEVTLTVPAEPDGAVEAMARLFAWRTSRRPGAGADDLASPVNLGGALRRCGAMEVLRPLRRLTAA